MTLRPLSAAVGGVALFVILLICLIALVAGSAFGIFFSAEPTGKGMTLKQAVQTLNGDYYQQLKELEESTPHDRVAYISADGSVSIHWEDALSVFAADMAAPQGTPILAAVKSLVAALAAGGGMETLYAHCFAIAVTVGQQVQQGEVIGYVGSTGNSTGNHLHFEVRVAGQQMDAMKYFTI